MIGWPSEGTWVRCLTPEVEAEQIRRLAAARAMGALRHKADCPCGACRIQRATFRRYLAKAVAA
jgi:hypothetical protein